MTEERFKLHYVDEKHISAKLYDNGTFIGLIHIGAELIIELLNSLSKENEQLKILTNNTSDQRNEFHRGARENANRVGKLEKENKELKLLVQNWETLDKEKNGQLDKQNQTLKKLKKENEELKQKVNFYKDFQKDARELDKKNEQLKKGMIEVIDKYIKNVDCNPPSSTRTYIKIKGALMNIREDLRDLIGDLE